MIFIALFLLRYLNGDSIRFDATQMREAFTRQLENKDYQRFLSKVPRVEGVWDDHDYGGEQG